MADTYIEKALQQAIAEFVDLTVKRDN